MPLRNPFSSWSRSSAGQPGSWRDADGSINWSRVLTTGAATLAGGPLAGRLATGVYDRFNQEVPSNYQLPRAQSPDMSAFSSSYQPSPGAATTNEQLRAALELYANQNMQNRIDGARTSAPQAPNSGASAPRHENALGYSNLIRSGGSSPYDGMERFMAANDINERVRGMVR